MLPKMWSGHGGLCCLVLICTVQFLGFVFRSPRAVCSRVHLLLRDWNAALLDWCLQSDGEFLSRKWRRWRTSSYFSYLLRNPYLLKESAHSPGGWMRWRKLIAVLGSLKLWSLWGCSSWTWWLGELAEGGLVLGSWQERIKRSLTLFCELSFRKTPQNQAVLVCFSPPPLDPVKIYTIDHCLIQLPVKKSKEWDPKVCKCLLVLEVLKGKAFVSSRKRGKKRERVKCSSMIQVRRK